MNWVWDQSPTSGTELLLLLAIADFADDSGGHAYPSKHTLAEKTRLDPSTVRRLVKRLEDAGHLHVQRSTGRGRANVYTVLMQRHAPTGDNDGDSTAERAAICRRGGLPPRQSGPQREARQPEKGGTATHPQPSGTIPEPPEAPPPRNTASIDPVAAAVLNKLGTSWHLSDGDRKRLAPLVTEKLVEGWPVSGLASYLSANPRGVVSPVAVLKARLQDLPAPRIAAKLPVPRPPWCGRCDELSRLRELDSGAVMRCPDCHPLRSTEQ